MKDKFRNKNGSLSVYAFACGYLETKPLLTAGGEKRLFRDGAVWHVQARDNQRGCFLWESFDKLTPARSFFSKVQA